VNRSIALICGMALLMASPALLAQRHGGRGVGGGVGRTPAGASKPDDLSEFKRSVALQATPDQVTEFERLTKSTQAARKTAQALLQLAGNQSAGDLFHSADQLTITVGDVQTDNQHFLRGLSSLQKSGLKDATKKLTKADAGVTKQNKALSQHLGRSAIDGKTVATLAEKIDDALSDLEARQRAIAEEMGIQPSENPE
jgi:hypothetical protein